ncbi:MAG: hypothetical protein L0387_28865 [Acidobacteria bacterium]|nr:hypothetical protein [Acidobacteriota bacterium]MCI0721356.1 hypothetical protein [Acidobacteriota bacterium]
MPILLGQPEPIRLLWKRTLLALCVCLSAMAAFSHPMGNFSISHYARLTLGPQAIDLLYIIDMAEIPAFQEKPSVDLNGNGSIETSEQDAYLSRKAGKLTEGLVIRLNGRRCPAARVSQQLELLPGGLNLPTLKITLNYRITLDAAELKDLNVLEYQDTNFPGRVGWKEIVVHSQGVDLLESSAGAADQSQQLTSYPEDPAIRPPEDLAASIKFKRAALISGSPLKTPTEVAGPSASPQQAPATARTKQPLGQSNSSILLLALLAVFGCAGFLVWRRFSRRPGA